VSARRLVWGGGGVVAAVLLAALAWGLLHPANPATASLLGRAAPDLVVEKLDGGQVKLSELRGRPVVLNFWASWCTPCQSEAETLRQAAESRSPAVAFLGVDFRDAPDAARAFQDQHRLPYPVGPSAGGIPAAYRVTQPPATFFIDHDGVAVARFDGPLTGPLIDRYLQLAGVR
jgi:cytochrome c biogenesis protein CcmG, thiol:disulfide interchange protein DsbE